MANNSEQFDIKRSIHDISLDLWQSLNISEYPFLDYHFLTALEDQHCIGEESGWHPLYLVRRDRQAIIPCFIKEHSYGEYVFDWSWADAYHQHNLAYYPKLLWAAPFTPATGPRLLMADTPKANDWQGALDAITQLATQHNLSGWHGNFLSNTACEQIPTAENPTLSRRYGCQFHWFNRQYQDFDHYLSYFTSRKRKAVRKERQRLWDADIELQRHTGDEISEADLTFFYHCYQLTYLKRRSQGYLNLAFFQQLRHTMSQQMLLVIARHEGQPIAAALYFFDQSTLYGRYWGCQEELDGLHFEACYYQGIEFCIERGLQRFDPGTQGEHKISRGFEPVLTNSLHWLAHPEFNRAVGQFVQEEHQQILAYQQQAMERLPFREHAFSSQPPKQPQQSQKEPRKQTPSQPQETPES